MSDVMLRIQRVTDDLRAIELELSRISVRGAQDRALSDVLEVLDMEVIKGLKAAVDNMRQLLWSYIEALSDSETSDPELSIHTLRLERATEMLRILEGPLQSTAMPTLLHTPEGHNFFSEVGRIASLTVERYYPESKSTDSTD